MTDTSAEINLQSKQDIICHITKVKPGTSATSGHEWYEQFDSNAINKRFLSSTRKVTHYGNKALRQ